MDFLDKLYSVWMAVGGTTALLMACFSVIFYLVRASIISTLDTLKVRLDKFEQSLGVLERAALSEEGQTISQARQLEVLNRVYTGLEKHVEKCGTYHESLYKAHHDLAELRADINQFTEDGKEARRTTQETVSKLGDRLDTFMEKILEVIRNLSDMGARRG